MQPFKILLMYFKDSSQFFLSRLSSSGYSNINTFLAGILLSPVFVTYYYLANKSVSVIITLFNPVVQTIYPYLSKKYNYMFLARLVSILMLISLLVISLGYLFSDLISIILLGEINDIFKILFHVIILIIPISILYVMLGAPLLLARGYRKEFNLSIIYGFVIHLLIVSILYFYFTIKPDLESDILILFAISLVFSKFIVLTIRMYYVFKNKLYMNSY